MHPCGAREGSLQRQMVSQTFQQHKFLESLKSAKEKKETRSMILH